MHLRNLASLLRVMLDSWSDRRRPMSALAHTKQALLQDDEDLHYPYVSCPRQSSRSSSDRPECGHGVHRLAFKLFCDTRRRLAISTFLGLEDAR
jgi:hypothetical protein